jgi:hypothetical protein
MLWPWPGERMQVVTMRSKCMKEEREHSHLHRHGATVRRMSLREGRAKTIGCMPDPSNGGPHGGAW